MGLFILTYLAGVLTILSPCILPVLPFVFARSQQSFIKSGLPLLVGMCVTFSAFSALAIVGGEWVVQANEAGRWIAIVLLTVFGLSLIFPHIAETLLSPLTRWGSKIGNNTSPDSFKSSFLIGIGTGLLWAPCAGPILGLVLTGAASQSNVGRSLGLLMAYSLGAATSLSMALVAGNKFLGTLKKFLGWDQVIKKVLGVAVLIGVVLIVFKLDRTVLTQLSKFETTSIESKLLSLIQDDKKPDAPQNSMMMMSANANKNEVIEGVLPELSGATGWLNSPALTKDSLLGKVVLIDFWTYSCINCLRTLPYVKAWAEKYKNDDFVVIGVHTPEFAFEKSLDNVKSAIQDLGINYPVAIDNQYNIWNAFQNNYWPAHYFIDRQGRIRAHHFGEGQYEESEKIIRDLITENGGSTQATEVKVQAQGVQAAASVGQVKSPETYLGYHRMENFKSTPSVQKDKITAYETLPNLSLNQWALDGNWIINPEKSTVKTDHGKIFFKFHSRDLHLVLGSAKKVKFKVSLDGQPPGENRGVDIDANGYGEINSHRLYQLIRYKNDNNSTDHLFEIEFFDSEVDAYAFTFG